MLSIICKEINVMLNYLTQKERLEDDCTNYPIYYCTYNMNSPCGKLDENSLIIVYNNFLCAKKVSEFSDQNDYCFLGDMAFNNNYYY